MLYRRALIEIDLSELTVNKDNINMYTQDRKSNIFDFKILFNGKPFNLENLNIELFVRKRNGDIVSRNVDSGVIKSDFRNGKFSYLLRLEDKDIAGDTTARLKIMYKDSVRWTPSITYYVHELCSGKD